MAAAPVYVADNRAESGPPTGTIAIQSLAVRDAPAVKLTVILPPAATVVGEAASVAAPPLGAETVTALLVKTCVQESFE